LFCCKKYFTSERDKCQVEASHAGLAQRIRLSVAKTHFDVPQLYTSIGESLRKPTQRGIDIRSD